MNAKNGAGKRHARKMKTSMSPMNGGITCNQNGRNANRQTNDEEINLVEANKAIKRMSEQKKTTKKQKTFQNSRGIAMRKLQQIKYATD